MIHLDPLCRAKISRLTEYRFDFGLIQSVLGVYARNLSKSSRETPSLTRARIDCTLQVIAMRPPVKKEEPPAMSQTQLEITKSVISATADVTAAMVQVTNEKNPAKISEAYRVIYKTILETIKSNPIKK